MEKNYINSFCEATKQVFALMLDLDLNIKEFEIFEGMIESKETNIHLGVVGDLSGSILFGLPMTMTFKIVEIMSGMELKQVDNFVTSALGEVANIIAGNAMTLLSKEGKICDIAPPEVLIGDYESIYMASNKGYLIPIESEIGNFELKLILKEK